MQFWVQIIIGAYQLENTCQIFYVIFVCKHLMQILQNNISIFT